MRILSHSIFNCNKNLQKLNKLCTILSRIFKKPVELDLVRLHLPFFDDNILVRAIGIMTKKVHVRNIINYILTHITFNILNILILISFNY